MDLPFAVDSSPERHTSLHYSNASSLVTASSQGSILPGESSDQSSIYSSHDPSYLDFVSHQQAEVVPAATEIIDFTYVNVFETDADEVEIMMEGRDPYSEADMARGDVLAVLLSGGTQEQGGESIVVRTCI